MLNDDNTTKKLIKYTKLWGYGGFTLTNLYPYVCANINDLKKQNAMLENTIKIIYKI